jgi:CD109 antigen
MVASKKTLEPSEVAKITFTSTLGSTIFLLGVDNSVNILKAGNNIDAKRVSDDFMEYSAYKNFDKLKIMGTYSNDLRYVDFGDSNAVILTNAYKGEVKCDTVSQRLHSGPLYENDQEPINFEPTPLQPMSDFKSKTREDFPETWLFRQFSVDNKGKAVVSEKVPDTITSWDVSAFALSESNGLGIAKPLKLYVMQGFFAKLNLPYSVRVGEILRVEVLVYNYFVDGVLFNVDVKLESKFNGNGVVEQSEDDETDEPKPIYMPGTKNSATVFDFYDPDRTSSNCQFRISRTANREGSQTKQIKVARNSGTSVYFYIKAKNAGEVKLKVRAEASTEIYDEVIKTLRVKHGGIRKFNNLAYVTDLRNKRRDSYDFPITFTENFVTNSVQFDVGVVGGIIGPSLDVKKIEPSSYM